MKRTRGKAPKYTAFFEPNEHGGYRGPDRRIMVVVQGRIDGWWNDLPKADSPRKFQSFGPPADSGNDAVPKSLHGNFVP